MGKFIVYSEMGGLYNTAQIEANKALEAIVSALKQCIVSRP